MEVLTRKLALEYQERARQIKYIEDVGERRKLRIEFQKRFGLLEIEAINLLNGYYTNDYIRRCEIRIERSKYGSQDDEDVGRVHRRKS